MILKTSFQSKMQGHMCPKHYNRAPLWAKALGFKNLNQKDSVLLRAQTGPQMLGKT